jgi:hypothetical protein
MSDDNEEFGLVRSFGVDEGELNGIAPHKAFVLGYELAMIDALIEAGGEISTMMHVENRGRVAAELEKHGRDHRFIWCAGDASESWMQLIVAPSPRTP